VDKARAAAEQRASGLANSATQLASTQRDLANLRAENGRLNDNLQAMDRDRSARIAQLQQENASISARLKQAQGTLDQIAAAARVINGGADSSTLLGGTARPTPPIVATAAAPTPAVRYHVVAEGDSLSRISVRYYGTANRWQEIYDANREMLRGENALRPGQRLRIP
jgi:nucleoid-associated protein YgaU